MVFPYGQSGSSVGTRRCGMCDINYPNAGNYAVCFVCEEPTNQFSNVEKHENWEELVRIRKAPIPDSGDRVFEWRLGELIQAGYADDEAFFLANERHIDLHQAIELRKKTHLAYAILV